MNNEPIKIRVIENGEYKLVEITNPCSKRKYRYLSKEMYQSMDNAILPYPPPSFKEFWPMARIGHHGFRLKRYHSDKLRTEEQNPTIPERKPLSDSIYNMFAYIETVGFMGRFPVTGFGKQKIKEYYEQQQLNHNE